MAYKFINYYVAAGVAHITLNRPEVVNSIHRPMAQELIDAFNGCATDRSVRAVLLSGEGRAFCAGQDLSEVNLAGDEELDLGEIVRNTYNPLVLAIRELEKPVVCAVNGVAAGAGASLALVCDIVLASKDASFIQAFCHVGLIPDSAGTYFLPRLVGWARASALMMLGEKISATDAQQMGLIYKVSDQLAEEASALAKRLALQATVSLGLVKKALWQSFSNDLPGQLALEEELQRECGKTSDFKEGIRAFREKRKPEFIGG